MSVSIFTRLWFTVGLNDSSGNPEWYSRLFSFFFFFLSTCTRDSTMTIFARAFLPREFPMTEWTDSRHVILYFDWYSPASGILSQGKTKPESRGRNGAESESGDISCNLLSWDKCTSVSQNPHKIHHCWKRVFRKTLPIFFSLFAEWVFI